MRKNILNKLHIIKIEIRIKNFFIFVLTISSPNMLNEKRNIINGSKEIETTLIENCSNFLIFTPSVKNLDCEKENIPEITKEIEIIDPNIENSFGSKTLDKYKVFINEIIMLIK